MEAGLHTWQRAHPEAIWVEIDTELDLHQCPARRSAREGGDRYPNAAARSPDCGGLLVQRGNPTRTVVTDGDQTVRLTRSYQTRPASGAGLSPYR